MAKQTGTFIDDTRLVPRDNSGGSTPMRYTQQFGDGGKVTGGEAADTGSSANEDEFTAAPRAGSRGKRGKGGY